MFPSTIFFFFQKKKRKFGRGEGKFPGRRMQHIQQKNIQARKGQENKTVMKGTSI